MLPWVVGGSTLIVLAGTALGLLETRFAFGSATGALATQYWLSGPGAGLILLLSAIVIGALRSSRALFVAVAASVLGAAVSLADYVDIGSVRGAAFDWLLRPDRFTTRLTGIIPSPNGVAALLIVPTGVLIAVALLGRGVRIRLMCALGAAVMIAALYFTYSRAALIGLALIAIVVAWRFRAKLGAALLAVTIVGGILVLPTYLRARNDAVGGEGAVRPGDLLVASDALRFRAWGAAATMFAESPVTGRGFLSYQVLHESYGDPILRSPHNEWLRLFAEEGIVIGLAGLVLAISTAGMLAVARGVVATGALGGFLGFVVAATFNNPFLYVQVLTIACTIVGIVIGRELVSAARPPVRAVPRFYSSTARDIRPRDEEGDVDDAEGAQEGQ
jgi:hypothetical protein